MCITFTTEKAEALRCGDLSGSVIHPIFVALATLLGYVYWQDANSKYDFAREQEFLLAVDAALLLLKSEEGFLSEAKLLILLRASCLLAYYHFWRMNLEPGMYHFNKSAWVAKYLGFPSIIQSHTISIPPGGRASGKICVDAWDEQEERVTALCQAVYIDSDVQLYKSGEPVVADEIVDAMFQLKVRRTR